MRLIDADALEREMYRKSFEVDDGRQRWNSGLWIRYKIFEEAIRDALTVEAEPVIRCCDCLHFKYFENQFVQMTRCDVHDRCPDYTDFCSWAERKEE